MTLLKTFDYEGQIEYTIENKIIEYDKRVNKFILHMIQNDDYSSKVIKARQILEQKRREKIEEYTGLFFNIYPYESENPVLEAREIFAHLDDYNRRRKA